MTIRHSMVARRMHRTSGKPQQPASPASLALNRARSHCSGNGPNDIHRRALQHLFSEKEGRGLSPGQISDLDRARRGVRRTSKESAGDSVGAPPQRPGSEKDMLRAATLPGRREHQQAAVKGAGQASSPPARFPAELFALRCSRSRSSGGYVAIRQATRRRTPRKEDGRRGPGVADVSSRYLDTDGVPLRDTKEHRPYRQRSHPSRPSGRKRRRASA